MVGTSRTIGLRARWVFPVIAPPIEGGTVVIRDQRIVSVGRHAEAEEIVDLGNSAILPGLVNCHTHLEFSALSQPVAARGTRFSKWIDAVVQYRRRNAGPEERSNTITDGLHELRTHGTALIGEIATETSWPRAMSNETLPGGIRFLELIGTTPERQAKAREVAEAFVGSPSPHRWTAGLSPHAPYTVALSLLEWSVELARRAGTPLAMHIAETEEELELVENHTGPLRDLLESLSAWDERAIPQGTHISSYLDRLAAAPRSLVIHGNYLDSKSTEILATHRQRMSLVYCPRTHAYFGHDRYPLQSLLDKGIHVALGTDSRASNPDLSLFEEARWIADQQTTVAPSTIVRLATREGAIAMGQADTFGALASGFSSDVTIVTLPSRVNRPYDALFHSESRVQPLSDLKHPS